MRRAAKGLLVNDARAVQRKATLHWVLVQLVALGYLLERRVRSRRVGSGEALLPSTTAIITETEQRAWAHGSLAELWLLRLADATLSADERTQFARKRRPRGRDAEPFLSGRSTSSP